MNYDMYGFPDELYRQNYPAPGSVVLAREVAAALAGRLPMYGDTEWGFDHGTWVVLARMFPQADIPVIQLSIDYSRPPEFHFELAALLQPLRRKGVLILGSGNLVHNLRQRQSADGRPFDWAEEFDARIAAAVDARDFQQVVNFQQLGRLAELAHPSYDHFLPLLYVLGLTGPTEPILSFCEGFQMPAASMRSFMVRPDRFPATRWSP
jgi:4,5-DOPA dioxygenase extradiol